MSDAKENTPNKPNTPEGQNKDGNERRRSRGGRNRNRNRGKKEGEGQAASSGPAKSGEVKASGITVAATAITETNAAKEKM